MTAEHHRMVFERTAVNFGLRDHLKGAIIDRIHAVRFGEEGTRVMVTTDMQIMGDLTTFSAETARVIEGNPLRGTVLIAHTNGEIWRYSGRLVNEV